MRKLYLIIAAAVGLAVIGILAGHVGGVTIRNTASQPEGLALTLSQPAMRGVPVAAHWQATDGNASGDIEIFFRTSAGELTVGRGRLEDQQATATFPCDADSSQGTVIMRKTATKQVVASSQVELLPSGPECAATSR